MTTRAPKTVDEQFAAALASAQFDQALAAEVENSIELAAEVQAEQPQPRPAESEEEASRKISSLSTGLLEREYHPVLIFGVSASGKTTLLTSLLNYFVDDNTARSICILGDSIFSENTQYGSRIHEEATRFFNRVVSDFSAGVAAPSTRFEYPFFIPIEIRPQSGKSVRLALLESRGEFWNVRKDSATYFPILKDEIVDLYRNYPGPISVIIVAPFALSDVYAGSVTLDEGEELRECDAALLASLQSYQKFREHPSKDKFLLLLSKWDLFTKGIYTREFAQPPNGQVEALIRQRFPRAWAFYQSMPQNGGKAVINYSAGVISGTDSLPIPGQLRALMHRYPRKVWTWLYAAASGGAMLVPDGRQAKRGWFRRLIDVFA